MNVTECNICYSVVRIDSMKNHIAWHKIAASPMAHGMYVNSRLDTTAKK